MKHVSETVHYAAHRFGIVAGAGGRLVASRPALLAGQTVDGGHSHAEVKEFATADGAVIARRVTAGGETLCWLRSDLAEAAGAALEREAAEHRRVIAEVGDFIRETDLQGARRNSMTVEQYRAKRHADGMRWDKYRAKQRAGGY
jgi:hypothetical protein